MKFLIPDIGDTIELKKDWTFHFYLESRNLVFLEQFGEENEKKLPVVQVSDEYFCRKRIHSYNGNGRPYGRSKEAYLMTLPAGTKLTVDRIFIRKNMSDFSSLTFVMTETPDLRFAHIKKKAVPFEKGGRKMIGRFWAKLDEANNIEFK